MAGCCGEHERQASSIVDQRLRKQTCDVTRYYKRASDDSISVAKQDASWCFFGGLAYGAWACCV
eukprot:2393627-Pyramimonas_sp.AAC.1